jgi:hypothetical protein
MINLRFISEVPDEVVSEMSSVIRLQIGGASMSHYDLFVDEIFNFLGCGVLEWCSFRPSGHTFHSYCNVLDSSICLSEWSYQINLPSVKHVFGQEWKVLFFVFWWCMSSAMVTLFHILFDVFKHFGPPESIGDDIKGCIYPLVS